MALYDTIFHLKVYILKKYIPLYFIIKVYTKLQLIIPTTVDLYKPQELCNLRMTSGCFFSFHLIQQVATSKDTYFKGGTPPPFLSIEPLWFDKFFHQAFYLGPV